MEGILLVVHIVVAVAIVLLILLQKGKGASMGASFGAGASETVFGAVGRASIFARITAVLAFIFFTSSFAIAVIERKNIAIATDEYDLTNQIEQIEPAQQDFEQFNTDLPADASTEEPIFEDIIEDDNSGNQPD